MYVKAVHSFVTMSYLLKSALGYLGGAAANVGQDNDFVGQYVELGPQKLRVKRVIAEGVSSQTAVTDYCLHNDFFVILKVFFHNFLFYALL